MKYFYLTFKLLIVLLLVVILPVSGQAREPMYHSADSILFEVIEDGVISSKRVSLGFDANKTWAQGLHQWAECRITIITINDFKKRIELDTYYSSTDQGTIKNLSITSEVVSFEMTPYPLAPDRSLKLIATRDEKSNSYYVSVVGLWTHLLTKNKLVKIEWRQVPSLKLPYTTIGEQTF